MNTLKVLTDELMTAGRMVRTAASSDDRAAALELMNDARAQRNAFLDGVLES